MPRMGDVPDAQFRQMQPPFQERARDLFGKETGSSRNRGMCLNKDRTIR